MTPDRPRELIHAVWEAGHALAALNVNNMETVQAVIAAAEDAGSPVILQISPGAIAYAGYETITALVISEAKRASIPAFVHLDHCQDPALVRTAMAGGFTSVMFDGSTLPYEENVAITAALVLEAHERGIAVEGELGVIGGSESMTLDDARRSTTTPADAEAFVKATGVDILAPALGTVHRMPSDSVVIDLELLSSLSQAARRPLALHGASGIQRSQLPVVIASGVGKVNVSSRISRAFAAGVRGALAEREDHLDLRRYLGAGRDAVRQLAADYIELCGALAGEGSSAGRNWSSAVREPE